MIELNIFTVGHSNHPLELFIKILDQANIDMIADVRSAPFSKMYPHFNRDSLEQGLKSHSIGYLFLGEQLGGRSKIKSDYHEGRVVYSRLAEKEEFQSALQRLLDGAAKYKIALLCSEKEPIDCHRTILVSQSLHRMGVKVSHLHADGKIESHESALSRLLVLHHLDSPDLFNDDSTRIQEALVKQERKIAYQDNQVTPTWDNQL